MGVGAAGNLSFTFPGHVLTTLPIATQALDKKVKNWSWAVKGRVRIRLTHIWPLGWGHSKGRWQRA